MNRRLGERRLDRTGVDGAPWGDVVSVRLRGEPRSRRAHLALIGAMGRERVIKEWRGLRHHRHKGWDHDAVRWFAARVAELAEVPLRDELGEVEAWVAAADRTERPSGVEDPRPGPAVAPAREVTHDGVEFRIAGDNGVRPVGAPSGTSWSSAVPVVVSATHLGVGRRRVPVEAIHDVLPWFGEQRRHKRVVAVGRLRAITDHGAWVLAERMDARTPEGVIRGAADALRAEVEAAKANRQDAGRAAEVPDSLRALAGQREPGAG